MSDNVTASETIQISTWLIPVLSAVAGSIITWLGTFLYGKYQERKRTRKENLKIHFKTINEEVIEKIYHMSLSLGIQNNEVKFLSSEEEIELVNLMGERIYKSQEPILEHYEFEKYESYLSFEVHFPEKAQEWRQLKNEALIVKSYCDTLKRGTSNNKVEYDYAKSKFGSDFFPLQKKFKDFALRLNNEVETIGKYQIGTAFKYNSKCPICRKF